MLDEEIINELVDEIWDESDLPEKIKNQLQGQFNKSNITHNQHYLPQFLLRKFKDPKFSTSKNKKNWKIWQQDVHSGECKLIKIKDAAAEEDLYETTSDKNKLRINAIEDAMGITEGAMANSLNDFSNNLNKPTQIFPIKNKINISIFLSLLTLRTPHRMKFNHDEAIAKAIRNKLILELRKNNNLTQIELNKIANNYYSKSEQDFDKKFIIDNYESLAKWFMSREIIYVKNNQERLTIPDSGYVSNILSPHWSNERNSSSQIFLRSLHSSETGFIFPISTTETIGINADTNYINEYSTEEELIHSIRAYVFSNPPMPKYTQLSSASWAKNFIYAFDKNCFSPLEEIKERKEIYDPSIPQISLYPGNLLDPNTFNVSKLNDKEIKINDLDEFIKEIINEYMTDSNNDNNKFLFDINNCRIN